MIQQEIINKYPVYTGKRPANFIDLQGQTFGRLKVLYRTLDKENVASNRRAQWVCECQCQNKTICVKSGIALRNGEVQSCGCMKGNRTVEETPGTKFGWWEIIERVPNKSGDRVYYKCKCTKCNSTIAEVSYHHLKDGTSTACQPCRAKTMTNALIIDEIDNQYGYLKVIRQAEKNELPRSDAKGIYWICDCLNCGRQGIVVKGDYLRNGDTSSCGCLRSKNESLIASMLEKEKINYKQQYYFQALGHFFFDFAVIETNQFYIIEYDGIQHFDPQHHWNGYSYEKTHNNDLLKNKYCFEHNIPLIRIPYDAKYDLSDLKLETTRFLLTPENEKEYYERK